MTYKKQCTKSAENNKQKNVVFSLTICLSTPILCLINDSLVLLINTLCEHRLYKKVTQILSSHITTVFVQTLTVVIQYGLNRNTMKKDTKIEVMEKVENKWW